MPETVVHFQIRMPPVLHEQLASWAKDDKASLNALIVGILEKAIEQHEKVARFVETGPWVDPLLEILHQLTMAWDTRWSMPIDVSCSALGTFHGFPAVVCP